MTSFMSTTGLSPLSHQDVLESTARLIDKQLQDDRNFLELSDQLKVPVHSKITLLLLMFMNIFCTSI
jgi:hypothetical protein